MAVVLNRTRTVLERRGIATFDDQPSPSDAVLFGPPLNTDPGDAQRHHRLFVERGVWADMGEPDTITVTIEPGDLLNEDT
jgi:hypothetical protein